MIVNSCNSVTFFASFFLLSADIKGDMAKIKLECGGSQKSFAKLIMRSLC